MTMGAKIRILRQERNMTQKELAAASGLAEITIQGYEADKFKPKIEQINKLATALNVPPSQISTENYWLNPEGRITTQLISFIDESHSYHAYKKKMRKNLYRVLEAVKKRDFQSDLIVEMVMMLLSMNPAGQEEVYRQICDLVELPKYKKEDLPQADE